MPLVGVAAYESIEVLKAHAYGPLIEWPSRAGLEFRRVVVFSKPSRPVAVVLQDAADGGLVAGNDTVVAGIAGRLLRDNAETSRMVVAAGDQRGARWRAERGGIVTDWLMTLNWLGLTTATCSTTASWNNRVLPVDSTANSSSFLSCAANGCNSRHRPLPQIRSSIFQSRAHRKLRAVQIHSQVSLHPVSPRAVE